MKIQMNIEFDSIEEYNQFGILFQQYFSTKPTPEKRIPKRSPIQKPPEIKQIKRDKAPQQLPSIPNFRPPSDMLTKVNDFIETGKSFKTADVAANFMNKPKRRAFANKWLQSHPDLVFEYKKQPGVGGKGVLTYTPIRYKDGVAILPPGQTSSKTDWPIKGASAKRPYAPNTLLDDDENDDLISLLDDTSSDIKKCRRGHAS